MTVSGAGARGESLKRTTIGLEFYAAIGFIRSRGVTTFLYQHLFHAGRQVTVTLSLPYSIVPALISILYVE